MAEKRTRKSAPVVNFDVSFSEVSRPPAKGAPPTLMEIHNRVLATYHDGTAVSIKAPSDVAGFIAAFRSVLRKNNHKERVAYKQDGASLVLWAEEPRLRKRKVKEAA
jgi:hypothetical protein